MKYTPRVALFGDYYTSDRLGPPVLCHHHIQAAEGWLTCYNADDSESCGLGSWPPGQQMASTITSCGSSSKYQQAPSVAVATGSSQRIFQRFPRSVRICSGIAALQYISTHTIDQKQAANEEEDEYIPSCHPPAASLLQEEQNPVRRNREKQETLGKCCFCPQRRNRWRLKANLRLQENL